MNNKMNVYKFLRCLPILCATCFWMLRMRYDPFYEVLEKRVLERLQNATQLPVTE